MKTNRPYLFLIAVIVIILDQLSKFAVSNSIMIGEKLQVIPEILSLTKAYNTGAAFSILQDKTPILIIFSLFVAIIIIYYFLRRPTSFPFAIILGWGLILGGTVGNLIDRLYLGYVVDFIKLDFVNFPIFNLADFSINIGAFVVLIYTLRSTTCPISNKTGE